MPAESRVLNLVIACLISALFISKAEAQDPCITLTYENGVCVPIWECKPLIELLNNLPKPLSRSATQIVRQSRCNNSQNHHVCCMRDVPVVTDSPRPDIQSVSGPDPQPTTPDLQPHTDTVDFV